MYDDDWPEFTTFQVMHNGQNVILADSYEYALAYAVSYGTAHPGEDIDIYEMIYGTLVEVVCIPAQD